MPSNALHTAFREAAEQEQQLQLIAETPELLEEEDGSWEAWLPLHNAARWGASGVAVRAAVAAYPDATKICSKGGYEPLHLCAMGGHFEAVEAIVIVIVMPVVCSSRARSRRPPHGLEMESSAGSTPYSSARALRTATMSKSAQSMSSVMSCCTVSTASSVVDEPTGVMMGFAPPKMWSAAAPGQ